MKKILFFRPISAAARTTARAIVSFLVDPACNPGAPGHALHLNELMDLLTRRSTDLLIHRFTDEPIHQSTS